MQITDKQLQNYKIFIGGNSECFLHAASELKKYLLRITGVTVEIANNDCGSKMFILSVDKELDLAHTDAFKTGVLGDNVYIVGKTERGLIYGVYDLIERFLGVDFFTADCETVPFKKVIEIGEFSYEPLFSMRTYLVGDTFGELADQDFMAKVKVKDVYTEPDKAHGGNIGVYGRNVSHNFRFYVPYEKYGKTHPEFYRAITVNGEDMVTVDITNGLKDDGSIDRTMAESVVKSTIDEMYKDVVAMPDVNVFTLTQEDGPDYFDDDHNRSLAKIYKRSGLLVRFCNAVVRGVNKRAKKELGRTIKLMTFAYDYAKDAPVKTIDGKVCPIDQTVIADENLIIQFALFSNGAYGYFDVRQNEDVLKPMREWQVIAKEFWFWGYDIAFNNYFAFYDTFKNIDENVKGFKDYGISYLCIQGSNDSKRNWQCNMRAYAYRQKMNGNSLSAKELIDKYINGYYSVAGDSVRKFIKLFHDNYSELLNSGKPVNFMNFGSFALGENNPYRMLESAVEEIEKGEELIKRAYSGEEKDVYLKRLAAVKTTALDLIYLNYYYYFPDGNETGRAKCREKFVSCARFAGIDRAREGYTLDAYVEFTESEVVIPGKEKIV